jgi:DNA-binding response OmpR family regulator
MRGSQRPTESNERTMKILIVDDSILIRRSLVKLLGQIKCQIQIVEAVNVPEGVRLMNECRPDMAIIDIEMPGGSGFDVLKEAGKLERKPVTIMLSRYATEEFRTQATEGGADHFLDKATDIEKITEIVEAYDNE